jgi:hypothetical protein
MNLANGWDGMGWMEWHCALDWVKNTNAMRCPKMKQESKDKESGWGRVLGFRTTNRCRSSQCRRSRFGGCPIRYVHRYYRR